MNFIEIEKWYILYEICYWDYKWNKKFFELDFSFFIYYFEENKVFKIDNI